MISKGELLYLLTMIHLFNNTCLITNENVSFIPAFLGVRIENCVANNTLAGDQSKTYAVFENG